MSAIHSASEHVAVWPVGEPLPSFAGVQQMGVRNLKETLVKMQVDFRGCLTRGDYEKRVLSHLDVLYRAIGEDSQIPALHSDIEARVANAQLADQKIVVHKSSEETTQDLVPSLDDIQAMALPELRDTLRKLGVSSKGCHTKADYRTRLREHVEEHCAGFHDSGDEVESNSIAGSKAQAVADGIDGTKMESMQPSTPATHSGWTSPDSGWASEQETWHPIAKSENEELLEDPSEARYREALLPWLIELSADIWPSMARKNPAIARAVIAVLARADATKGLEAQAVDVGWYLHAGSKIPSSCSRQHARWLDLGPQSHTWTSWHSCCVTVTLEYESKPLPLWGLARKLLHHMSAICLPACLTHPQGLGKLLVWPCNSSALHFRRNSFWIFPCLFMKLTTQPTMPCFNAGRFGFPA